jgi:hypothetical protein
MTTWEYRIERLFEYDSIEPELNRLGKDRWELVASLPSDYGVVLVFKRPKQCSPS